MQERILHVAIAAALGGCGLIPSVTTECSASRPCPDDQICSAATSTCEALPATDMAAPACQGPCVPCQRHTDCPSQVCDSYQPSALGGTCVLQSSLIYVDNRGGACTVGQGGDGQGPNTGVCSLSEGLTLLDGARKTALRLLPSRKSYGPLVLTQGDVTIYGQNERGQHPLPGAQTALGGDANQDGVTVRLGAHLILNGVDVSKSRLGVVCSDPGSRIALRGSRIEGAAYQGVQVSDCALELDRSLLSGAQAGALQIDSGSTFRITNTFIVRNQAVASAPTLRFADSTSGFFRFNTVADNLAMLSAAAIECGTSIDLRDSILVRNSRVGASQFKGICKVYSSVVGSDAAPGIHADPQFTRLEDLDYALDPNQRGCCLDKVLCTNATSDFFGNRRPRGLACDSGAHEAR